MADRPIPLKEAATLVKRAHVTLRLQAQNGRLRARKIGRDWFVTVPALRSYLKSIGDTTTLPDDATEQHKPAADESAA